MLIVLLINAASGAQSKLAKFIQDMTAEEPVATGPAGAASAAVWKGQGKAE